MKKTVKVVLEFEIKDEDDVLENGNLNQVRLGYDKDGDAVVWLDGCKTEETYVISMSIEGEY